MCFIYILSRLFVSFIYFVAHCFMLQFRFFFLSFHIQTSQSILIGIFIDNYQPYTTYGTPHTHTHTQQREIVYRAKSNQMLLCYCYCCWYDCWCAVCYIVNASIVEYVNYKIIIILIDRKWFVKCMVLSEKCVSVCVCVCMSSVIQFGILKGRQNRLLWFMYL